MDKPTPSGGSTASQPPVPAEQFLKGLAECELFTAQDVQAIAAGITPAQRQDARLLADSLIQQGKLTRYQAHMLLVGKPRGLVFDTYVILEKLGQGGMGMVFKAQHRRMKRLVALKVLSPAITKNPNAVQRFQREVEAAAKLIHPNIVAAYDADEAKDVHFLVMEFVEGSDLSKLVKKNGPLQVGQAVQCIIQAAHGLLHAHQSGIIHRDIKPHNLLISLPSTGKSAGSGVVKILDMGLARIEGANTAGSGGELTESGSIMGTCDYMAPEQAMNTKNADARADIYSLGCTLYYLLAGKGMYGGETAMEKLMAHQSEPIPPLRAARPDVPKNVDAVYQKMVAKKVAERYQSMAEVIADLEACKLPGTDLSELGATDSGRPPSSAPQDPEATLGETQSSLDDMTYAGEKTQLTPERKQAKKRRRRFVIATVLAFFLAMSIIQVNTDKGTFILETDDPEVAGMLDKAGGVMLHDKKANRTYQLRAGVYRIRSGDYEMTAAELPAGVKLSATSFSIRKDGEVRVQVHPAARARVERQPPAAADPGGIKLLTPAAGTVLDNGDLSRRTPYTWHFTWDKVPRGTKYHLQVTGPNGKIPMINRDDLAEPSFRADHKDSYVALLNRRGWRWQVRAFVDGKWTDWSEARMFDVVPPRPPFKGEPPVTLLAPPAGAVLENAVPERMSYTWHFTWEKLPLATGYHFQLFPLNGNEPTHEKADLKEPSYRLDYKNNHVPDANLNGWRWRVRALFAGGRSTEWSERTFNVRPFRAATVDDVWIKQVQALPPDKQVDAVTAKLKELNPGFDGKAAHKIEGDAVTELTFESDSITDLGPIRGLTKLLMLNCQAREASKLADLTPLQGLPLRHLNCANTRVAELAPLRGMPLTYLNIGKTAVVDLAPLRGMPLNDLQIPATPIVSLAALEGMPLKSLNCAATPVSDLTPLVGMPLTILNCAQSKVTDLTPLKGLPLTHLWCDYDKLRDVDILRAIKTLQRLNDRQAPTIVK